MYPPYPRPEIAMIVVARSARSFVHLLIVITIYVRQSSTQTTLGMPAISSAPPGWVGVGVGWERETQCRVLRDVREPSVYTPPQYHSLTFV